MLKLDSKNSDNTYNILDTEDNTIEVCDYKTLRNAVVYHKYQIEGVKQHGRGLIIDEDSLTIKNDVSIEVDTKQAIDSNTDINSSNIENNLEQEKKEDLIDKEGNSRVESSSSFVRVSEDEECNIGGEEKGKEGLEEELPVEDARAKLKRIRKENKSQIINSDEDYKLEVKKITDDGKYEVLDRTDNSIEICDYEVIRNAAVGYKFNIKGVTIVKNDINIEPTEKKKEKGLIVQSKNEDGTYNLLDKEDGSIEKVSSEVLRNAVVNHGYKISGVIKKGNRVTIKDYESNRQLRDGIRVLSLCDGMSCCRLALERAGFKIDKYYASEIKPIAIKVAKYNHPETIEIGDVNNVHYENGILKTEVGDFKEDFDLVAFGSPCQSFSIACSWEMRTGLEDKKRSGLFYECDRVLKEVNPKYFLVENVASMPYADKVELSKHLGVEAIQINSELIAPALRDRYYWTNIPNVEQPEKKEIKLQDVLTEGYTDREKARCLMMSDGQPNTVNIKMFRRYKQMGFTTLVFKDEEHYKNCMERWSEITLGQGWVDVDELEDYIDDPVFDGVRYMNQTELERCQTVPEGYTKCLTRNQAANVLGDGWTIDVIAHIFMNMV